MINGELAASLGIDGSVVPASRLQEFKSLASQTSLQERASLYAICKHAYSGEGGIWDIGCAAGGSTYCLAAGVQDNTVLSADVKARTRVTGFDLFDGYSAKTFQRRFPGESSDLNLFHAQTESVKQFVKAQQIDLTTDLADYEPDLALELVHIDAAKSPQLWKAIFSRIGRAIIPGKTVWIYQDFERSRLPWQVYSLADLMKYGDIIGGASLGTVYFRFHSDIAPDDYQKIAADSYTLGEKVSGLRKVYAQVRERHSSFFTNDNISIDDLENTALAYCHFWSNDHQGAKEILSATSQAFLSMPGHRMYSNEILSAQGPAGLGRRIVMSARHRLGSLRRVLSK
jgi:hypothetical protein